ncbi:receptor homology region, transmembrane domain- and RING domain-containing protein 1 [Durio zibethinus]|uniref:Receptor homology region, transmembrane domain- and RING domain-containing protein 1 n=1 Tax=Durio zibethinus TaxID=66656 RepID=A0A6P5YMR3_DURZI|nr:receptor homology region, transmembrane domain- and RING domain-containing protein 1 [Durio zibethinus]
MRETLLGLSLVFIAYFIELSSATVVLKPFSISFPDLPAKFALGNNTGVCGALQVADPLNACTPLQKEYGFNKTDPIRFALIIRGDCSFEEKIQNAQSGGFSAAIVYDDKDGGNLVYMMVNPKGIQVLAVFVSKSAGEFLKDHAKGEKGECCIYSPLNGKALTVFSICFLSLVVIAAFLVIAFIAPRCLSNWRRASLVKSVDTKMVEALPRLAFSSACLSTTGETCAICLEDYKDGEILKLLPCQHDFHSSCVESWLTKWGTFCPVCKLDMTTKIAYSEIKRSNSRFCIVLARDQKFVSAAVSLQSKDKMFEMMLLYPFKFGASKIVALVHNFDMGVSLVVFPCGLFLFLLIFYSSGSEVVTIDVTEAKNLLQSGNIYIDVRTVEEYKKGHVHAERILNIPYMFNTLQGRVKNPEFLKEVSSRCKEDDLLVVGCQSGVRSLYATADLLSIGFKNVSNMGGGYLAWVGNGFPLIVEKPAKVEEKPKEEL